MHMADALVSPAVATTMYLASGAMTIYSIKKLEEENTILRNCNIVLKDKIENLKWRIDELEWKVDDLKEDILELESIL